MRDRLIGAWRLETLKRFRDGKFDREPMGHGAMGRLIYDSGGVMSAFLMSQSFKRGEAIQTWDAFLSYSAQWSLRDESTVVHELDYCSIPALIGTPLVRFISWRGDNSMMLSTAPHRTKAGQQSHDELIWQRTTG
jgi:hypothetical protein